MRRSLLVVLLLALFATLAHHLYAPYRLRDAVAQATAEGRPELIEGAVDFEALRESVRMQLDEQEASDRTTRRTTSPLGGLDEVFRRAIVDEISARVGTPSGMVTMLQGRDPMKASAMRPLLEGGQNPFATATARWKSPTRVAIEGIGTRDGKGGATIVLTRVLGGWMVSDLRFVFAK